MEIVSFDKSILRVKLIGQCMTCPASADTFEESIKNVLLSEFKELKDVILVNDVPDDMLEAAKMDGANRFHKIVYITIPSIAPTITLFFILSVSGLLNNGIEHLLVFQNTSNIERSEVLDTYIYKYGIPDFRYSYATAIGLLKSIISLFLLVSGNWVCKKVSGKGIY